MADKTATFALNLESNAAPISKEAAGALEQFRAKIETSNEFIRQMQGALRGLRGASDDVKSAKEQLKAKLDAERGAVSDASLAILKMGHTYEELAENVRDAEKAQRALKKEEEAEKLRRIAEAAEKTAKGMELIGGPLPDLIHRFEALRGALGGAGGRMAMVALGAAAVALALVAAVEGVREFTKEVVKSGVELAKWVFEAGNAERSARLYSQAATGSAANAKALGFQINELNEKVTTSHEKLTEQANSLSKDLLGGYSRVSPKALIDTFNAVAQASSALKDDVLANQLKGFVERGKLWGRMGIGLREISGAGGFTQRNVATALAENLHVSLEKASAMLRMGRVKMDDGAKAIRDAVEKHFGKVNAGLVLDFGVQVEKLKDKLRAFTKEINLEPLLTAVQHFFHLFDAGSEVTGYVLKEIVTLFGTDLAGAAAKTGPVLEGVLKSIVGYVLDAVLAFYQARNAVLDFVGDDTAGKLLTVENGFLLIHKAADLFLDTLKGIKLVLDGLSGGALGVVGRYFEAASESQAKLVTAHKEAQKAYDAAMVRKAELDAVTAKSEAENGTGTRVPSEGPRPTQGPTDADWNPTGKASVVRLPTPPPAHVENHISVPLHFHIDAKGNSVEDTVNAVGSDDVLDKIHSAIRKALVSVAVPTQAPVT